MTDAVMLRHASFKGLRQEADEASDARSRQGRLKESPRPRYATGMAYDKALEQLRSRNPTSDPTRWEQAKHDAARFIEKWGDIAEAFGWPDTELFGIDPLAPFARYENMGLVWLLQGRQVEDLTEQFARIGRTRLFRKPTENKI